MKREELIIDKDSSIVDETGLFAKYIDYRSKDEVGHALMYMRAGSVGNSAQQVNRTDAQNLSQSVKNFNEILSHSALEDETLSTKVLEVADPWKGAKSPQEAAKDIIVAGGMPTKFHLVELSSIGLPAKYRETGLYIQVLELSQEKIKLEINLIRFTQIRENA